MVRAEGVEALAGEAQRQEKTQVAMTRQLAVILHCIWVNGRPSEWGKEVTA
jgi:hypothetical protein